MIKIEAANKDYRIVIEEDLPEVGFYVYVFNEDGNCIYDYLQNSLAEAKEFVKKKYGIHEQDWIKSK